MAINSCLLCVGAGEEQIGGIRIAQQLGCTVLAVDGNPNAPGLKIADYAHIVDLKNHQEVINLAKDFNIEGIIPVPLGSVLTTVGAVNDALGIKGISLKASKLCTDKLQMREALYKHGLPQPRFVSIASLKMLREIANNFEFPIVVKPRHGSGSREVLLLNNIIDIDNVNYRDNHFQSDYLIESFLQGQEYGVDGVVYNGNYRILAIRIKELSSPPFRVALSYTIYPLPSEVVSEITKTTINSAKALELTDCLFHADIMLDNDGKASIIEMSGRPSGFGISMELLPACIGINPVEQILKAILGQTYTFEPCNILAGTIRGLTNKTGKVISIGDIESAKSIPGLLNIRIGIKIGDFINPITSGTDWYNIGQAILIGNNESQIEVTWKKLQDILNITVQ